LVKVNKISDNYFIGQALQTGSILISQCMVYLDSWQQERQS